jgi:hypothetical protein
MSTLNARGVYHGTKILNLSRVLPFSFPTRRNSYWIVQQRCPAPGDPGEGIGKS